MQLVLKNQSFHITDQPPISVRGTPISYYIYGQDLLTHNCGTVQSNMRNKVPHMTSNSTQSTQVRNHTLETRLQQNIIKNNDSACR